MKQSNNFFKLLEERLRYNSSIEAQPESGMSAILQYSSFFSGGFEYK
jgi:hypothetical protein